MERLGRGELRHPVADEPSRAVFEAIELSSALHPVSNVASASTAAPKQMRSPRFPEARRRFALVAFIVTMTILAGGTFERSEGDCLRDFRGV
jgi:hypothetical protein